MMIKDSLTDNRTILRNYYRFQSMIYDTTRWSFLFGRNEILDIIAAGETPRHLLEIGCGTGYNLKKLAERHPDAQLTGMDVSDDMLGIARKKLTPYPNTKLIEGAYASDEIRFRTPPDMILFSYVLTMINPHYSKVILQAYEDLAPGGKIAVIDFHSTGVNWFKQHMANNHVRMDAHLNPILEMSFAPIRDEVRKAYFGLWNYFLFIGEKC
ncbi:MAG: class I SAM-dependent methyltransferase [Bacteroidota bacterium]